jgi:nucleoside-diphosphate-sugar epimerase
VRVVVTGGGGFVGLNVVEALLRRGDDVLALDRGPLHPHAAAGFQGLPGKLTSVEADVTSAGAIADVFAGFRPTHVVHAAVITPGPERERRDCGRIVEVNIAGVWHVLAAALHADVRRVAYVSSGSVYGRTLLADTSVAESDPPRPDSLYAVTKQAAEGICTRFREQDGLDVVCARVGSVFGPWERDSGVRDTMSLPYQMFALARRGEEIRLADREPRRDWIYSRDVALGLARLLDAPDLRHDVYNLAAGLGGAPIAAPWCDRLKAFWPALVCRRVAGEDVPNVEFLGPRDRALMLNTRIREETGFRPAYGTDAALDDYAAWLRSNREYHDHEN